MASWTLQLFARQAGNLKTSGSASLPQILTLPLPIMSSSLNNDPVASLPAGNAPPVVDDDYGPVRSSPILSCMLFNSFQCLYTDYQVGFLCHIGHLFEDALYTKMTEHFMQELFALWFRDWPEAPEHIERRKRVSSFGPSIHMRSNLTIHLRASDK